MSNEWIRCRIEKGMFSDEVVVVIKSDRGEDLAFFVPTSEVSRSAGQGKVRVRAIREESRALAIVPNDYQTVVEVDPREFVAA